VLEVRAQGSNSALAAHVENASNASDAVDVEHAGTGRGIDVNLTNSGNPSAAVRVSHAGTGSGIEVESAGGIGISVGSANEQSFLPSLYVSNAGAAGGIQVEATAMAVSAHSDFADAVYGRAGQASSNIAGPAGVHGESYQGTGVLGTTGDLPNSIGVRGLRGNYSGVQGSAFSAGVVGEADGTGTGLLGASAAGRAVRALTNSGIGVSAQTLGAANANPAIVGVSGGTGPAVRATGKAVPVTGSVPIAGNAAALDVKGRATFTRSGVATLAAAAASVVVPVPGGLAASSHVLATLQGVVAGALAVKSAAPNTANGKITIYFTGSAPSGTKVAWFVFG
jgi:hypothetical protein